jgi:hypothetical protein
MNSVAIVRIFSKERYVQMSIVALKEKGKTHALNPL